LAAFAKHLGVAYQIQNDLRDYHGDAENKVLLGGDVAKGRPTLLFALAAAAAEKEERRLLLRAAAGGAKAAEPAAIREIYERLAVPAQAATFAARQRERAVELAGSVPREELRALLRFLCAAVLD
jgi:geranylgeranyl pyrophosphate synthase